LITRVTFGLNTAAVLGYMGISATKYIDILKA
jgi:hypothetical protein